MEFGFKLSRKLFKLLPFFVLISPPNLKEENLLKMYETGDNKLGMPDIFKDEIFE